MSTHFITGGSGFVGRQIAEHLLKRGDRVISTFQPSNAPVPSLVDSAATFEPWSIDDTAGLRALLIKYRPQWIYHLASPSHVPSAQQQPRQTAHDIYLGTVDVVEAVRAAAPEARLLNVGSAEEYLDAKGAPLTEMSNTGGGTAYAISKAAATRWAATMGREFTVCVRPFNQIGPHQSPLFAVASFASQIARIMTSGGQNVLHVGNIDVERDFLDVRDSSLAHVMALEKGKPGEIYNIASGKPTRLRDIVEHMIKASGVPIEIVVDPARVRAGDIPRIVGDASKLRAVTGWKPESNAFIAAEDALRAVANEFVDGAKRY